MISVREPIFSNSLFIILCKEIAHHSADMNSIYSIFTTFYFLPNPTFYLSPKIPGIASVQAKQLHTGDLF